MAKQTFTHKHIAQTINEVGIKAIDYFSLLHIVTGLALNVLFSMFLETTLVLLSVIYCAVFWEFFENYIMLHYNIKFNNKRDSLINALMDIFFTNFGGILGVFIKKWMAFLLMMNLIVFTKVWKHIIK